MSTEDDTSCLPPHQAKTLDNGENRSIDRFPDGEKLCSYEGLVPSVSVSISGRHRRHGSITKEGSRWLRWIIVETRVHEATGSFTTVVKPGSSLIPRMHITIACINRSKEEL
jgi:transposase